MGGAHGGRKKCVRGKPEDKRKRPFGKVSFSWEANIKMDLR
jgi:hypothetical protein